MPKYLRDFFFRYQDTPGSDALYFLAAKSSRLPEVPPHVNGRLDVFDYFVKCSEEDHCPVDDGNKEDADAHGEIDTPEIEKQGEKKVEMEQAADEERPPSQVDDDTMDENLDPAASPDKDEEGQKIINDTVSSPLAGRLRRNLLSLNIRE